MGGSGVRVLGVWPLLGGLALLGNAAPAAGEPDTALEVAPGSIVRWAGPDAERCGLDGSEWPARGGGCLYPIDLLRGQGEVRLVRWRDGRRQTRIVRVGAYPYEVQHIRLPDDRMVHLAPEDAARAQREAARVARLWTRDGPAVGSLPLEPPLEDLPPGGRFGARRVINDEPRSPHTGADYAAPPGTPVFAAAAGEVALAEEHFFAGRAVFLDHGDGLFTMYFHLSEIEVATGERVERGQRIGRVGASGRATGPHLHFGVRWRGARIAPDLLLGRAEIPEIPD